MWAARLRWEERDLADYGSQDQEGLPQFLLRAVASEERTGAPCPLSPALLRDSSSTEDHTYLQELKGSTGQGQESAPSGAHRDLG